MHGDQLHTFFLIYITQSIIRYNVIILLNLFLFFNYLSADDYSIYLLGIPIVEVSMESSTNSLDFSTKTVGFIKSIWPVDNHYQMEYDSISFGIRQYKKSIHQGNYKGELSCIFESNNSQLNYNGQSITVVDSIQNIFTLLVRLSYQSAEYLDTKWYPMNHEGTPYRARFLLAGIEKVEFDDLEILCEHYRLDIEKTDGTSVHITPYDYFTDHVAKPKVLRQIWVEQGGERRIIKASVSLYGMTITAKIQE